MNDHINRFKQLVYDGNYNKPANTTNMEESVVNLKCHTLMIDKSTIDKWEMFINAKGPQLEHMSTHSPTSKSESMHQMPNLWISLHPPPMKHDPSQQLSSSKQSKPSTHEIIVFNVEMATVAMDAVTFGEEV